MTKEETEYFETVGTIEAGYFMLREITKARGTKTPLEKMIDNATGYEREEIKQIEIIVIDIIEAKKVIGEPVETENRILELIKTK